MHFYSENIGFGGSLSEKMPPPLQSVSGGGGGALTSEEGVLVQILRSQIWPTLIHGGVKDMGGLKSRFRPDWSAHYIVRSWKVRPVRYPETLLPLKVTTILDPWRHRVRYPGDSLRAFLRLGSG